MNVLRESITEWYFSPDHIRIWREESSNAKPDRSDLAKAIKDLQARDIHGAELAEELLKLDRVNAVQVSDLGEGFVVYRLEDDGSF